MYGNYLFHPITDMSYLCITTTQLSYEKLFRFAGCWIVFLFFVGRSFTSNLTAPPVSIAGLCFQHGLEQNWSSVKTVWKFGYGFSQKIWKIKIGEGVRVHRIATLEWQGEEEREEREREQTNDIQYVDTINNLNYTNIHIHMHAHMLEMTFWMKIRSALCWWDWEPLRRRFLLRCFTTIGHTMWDIVLAISDKKYILVWRSPMGVSGYTVCWISMLIFLIGN